jgi:hypothetical protein
LDSDGERKIPMIYCNQKREKNTLIKLNVKRSKGIRDQASKEGALI